LAVPSALRAGHLHVALRCNTPVPLQAEFDCAPGELVALVGPSGSGKTTLLRAIAGLYQPRGLQGTVRLSSHSSSSVADSAGQPADTGTAAHTLWFDSAQRIALPPQARRVGLVFQQYALFPHLSAMHNIAACADNTWAKGQKHAQAMLLLQRMGLADVAARLPHQLSGGQQQRVALARALVRLLPLDQTQATPPGVLLLDEPFSAVDAPMRQTLYRELAQLHASLQLPMVLVTHDLAEARRLANKVVILDGGTTLQSGPPERVLRSPRNARVAQLVGIHNHFAGQFYGALLASNPVVQANAANHSAPESPALGQLHWGSCTLHAIDKARIANGSAVTWVLAGESVQVLGAGSVGSTDRTNTSTTTGITTRITKGTAQAGLAAAGALSTPTALCATGSAAPALSAAPSDGHHLPEGDNFLPCQLTEMLPLGEICVCQLAVHGAPHGDSIRLNLSTAQLRQLGAQPGCQLVLHVPAHALHIMPVRNA
jgi:molybdate transport system ATP-binding protein